MKARLDARKAEGQRLFHHPDVRAQASSVPDHRVNRDITAVFLATEQAIEKILMQLLHGADFAKAVCPTFPHGLDGHRRRIVYHITGWLLRSALTRATRDESRVPEFRPFVNAHKYDIAEEFRTAHPDEEYKGLEAVVEEKNVKWEGKSLVFPSALFF